ncbi:MAG TPA: hypothetical protein VKF15_02055 [Nitrososphaerales archaeon]|nr:hypothetical protein [Nitrososphaerales archaeon]
MEQGVSNLWAWLHTWEDAAGGIHGPVVYHHRDNLKVLRPDTWTQGAALLGLLNVHGASGDQRFLEDAKRLGSFLTSNYIQELHVFRDSNFDQKPLGRPALEGNALASLSLFELGKSLGPEGRLFVETAKDNIDGFVKREWDPVAKSFAVKYHAGRAHIHNKGAMAILAILACEGGRMGELTGQYAVPAADFMMTCQVQEGAMAGAFPYADRDSSYRTIYSLVTALGLLGLHRATGEPKYLLSVTKLLDHLSKFVDPKTGLICHYHQTGYPQWITDTILYHLVGKLASEQGQGAAAGRRSGALSDALAYQYPSGAFPLSLGFEDLWYKDVMGAKPEIRRWRDVLPTPGMNAWNFWFLSSFLPKGARIPAPSSRFPHTVSSDREEGEGPYEITDSESELRVATIPGRVVRLLIAKQDDVPTVCDLSERSSYWKTIDSIMRYPWPVRRLILAAPRLFMKIRR